MLDARIFFKKHESQFKQKYREVSNVNMSLYGRELTESDKNLIISVLRRMHAPINMTTFTIMAKRYAANNFQLEENFWMLKMQKKSKF